jgi:MFS family permease
MFYGWRVVYGCLTIGVASWSLGLFGASVWLHALHASTGLSVGLVSSAITASYVWGALLQVWVGSAVGRVGPAVVVSFGALAMATGVVGIGLARTPATIWAAFLTWGTGWACLSTTTLTTTIAPWFERYQGRAVSTAMIGASVGGMIGTPILLFAIRALGLAAANACAALALLVIAVPIAVFVLRPRPHELGVFPDGLPPRAGTPTATPARWTRAEALRTRAVWTVVSGFGLGLLVQVGFLTHHVSLLIPALGPGGAAATVTLTAATALAGRMLLARFADVYDVRATAGGMLLLAAALLVTLSVLRTPAVLVIVSAIYGVTVAHVTTLFPIVVRREFGAASFGVVFGAAAAGVQLMTSLGPGFYGVLYDLFGGYGAPLAIAAAIDVVAATVVWLGRGAPVRRTA